MNKVKGIRVYMIIQGVGVQGLCDPCYLEFNNARMIIIELHNPEWDFKRDKCDHCDRKESVKKWRETAKNNYKN